MMTIMIIFGVLVVLYIVKRIANSYGIKLKGYKQFKNAYNNM